MIENKKVVCCLELPALQVDCILTGGTAGSSFYIFYDKNAHKACIVEDLSSLEVRNEFRL